jgi:DNA-binding NarL/FixJ family response regulator
MINVMIVDDHEMILESLSLLFDLAEGIQVVKTESDSRLVLNHLDTLDINVIIMDYRMPYLDGLQLTRLIREKDNNVKILILTVNEDSIDIQNAFNAGVNGYIMKKASRSDLEHAVNTVYNGKRYLSGDAADALLKISNSDEPTDVQMHKKIDALTSREIEIVKLLAQEMTSNEIAAKLHISNGTVETHRHNILKKLNVKSTVGVVKFGGYPIFCV